MAIVICSKNTLENEFSLIFLANVHYLLYLCTPIVNWGSIGMSHCITHIAHRICLCIVILCSFCGMHAAAQNTQSVKTIMRAWQLDPWTGIADTVPIVDTSYMHLPMRDVLNDYSISNITNANVISPTQSRIYFDRQKRADFIFADAYAPYIITPHDVKFYHTTTPYSSVGYKKGFVTDMDQNDISFMFTGNVRQSIRCRRIFFFKS